MKIYMMKGDAYIATRAHDYEMLETVEKGKEAINFLFLSILRR
jgi:hypothetical protein